MSSGNGQPQQFAVSMSPFQRQRPETQARNALDKEHRHVNRGNDRDGHEEVHGSLLLEIVTTVAR